MAWRDEALWSGPGAAADQRSWRDTHERGWRNFSLMNGPADVDLVLSGRAKVS
jgi:hypothetical protein